MKRTVYTIIALFFVIPSFAITLNVEKCKELALRNSEDIKIAEANKKSAEYKRKEYRSNFFPKLSFDVTYIYRDAPIEHSIDDGYLPTYSFNPETGGLTPNLFINPDTGNPVIGADGNPIFNQYAYFPGLDLSLSLRNAYMASVKATQPIFAGGKITNAYKLSKIGTRVAELNYKDKKDNILIQTELAYWRLVSLKEKVKLANDYESQVSEIVRQLSDAVEVGLIQQNELLKAQVKLNEVKLSKQKATHGFLLAKLALENLIGTELEDELILDDQTVNITSIPEVSTDMYMNRSDYNLLEANYKAQVTKKRIAFADYLPEIGVQGSYSELKYEINSKEKKSDEAMIMANFSLPLFKWGETYSKNKQAQVDIEKAKLTLQKSVEQMKLEIKMNEFALKDATLRIDMANSSIEQATENLRIERDRYDLKQTTLSDLLDAQTQWQKAEVERIDALIDYQNARLHLLKAIGQLNQ